MGTVFSDYLSVSYDYRYIELCILYFSVNFIYMIIIIIIMVVKFTIITLIIRLTLIVMIKRTIIIITIIMTMILIVMAIGVITNNKNNDSHSLRDKNNRERKTFSLILFLVKTQRQNWQIFLQLIRKALYRKLQNHKIFLKNNVKARYSFTSKIYWTISHRAAKSFTHP